MKKKLLSLMITLAMMVSIIPVFSGTSYAATIPGINDKSVYKVTNYVKGDCNLCANAYMLKRMAILLQSPGYKRLTNSELRGKISFDTDGCNNDVYFNYTYTNPGDGIKFTVKSASLTGSVSEKRTTIKNLLKKHPEGIVVWGPDAIEAGWPHAVLITGFNSKTNEFKCADSAYNKDSYNKGIMNFSDSMMRGLGYCTRYWYLSGTTLKNLKAPTVKKKSSKSVKVSWKDIYGQNRYQISKAKNKTSSKIVKTVKSAVANPVNISAKRKTKFFYKVRAFNYFTYTDWSGTKHEKYIYSAWSPATAFKLK